MRMHKLRVPTQPDDTSCGWKTYLHTYLLIKQTFNVPDDRRMDTYRDIEVRSFRAIQRIVDVIRERGQEEIDRAEEFARERQQRAIEQEE
ncbi:hypothetical protein GOP47_0008046 [Adiantum capillus-veneris]|uniref:Uncharacterized protein n=1 Tax=Adiantum capillus-veneris TaxID=13818 RepID=A0A9D4UY19_ADICA|nr:hypothetical protein GOP47_0008046 [Adiantum capillus-veneris]